MSAFLLDVNVLIALGWGGHPDHDRVSQWFTGYGARGWATCPITQAAFVRIVSNPAFSAHAASPREALRLLTTNLRHPKHQFWPDDVSLGESVSRFEDRLVGHQQITDAYLLGLSVHKNGKLATLDRGIMDLLPAGSPYRASVELISRDSGC
ncbi:MAG: TA system VapC family ribonuclease toxin [Terriglobales bacterium]